MSEFNQGYACAVACIIRGQGESTGTREALEVAGLTSLEILIEQGVDPYDVKILAATVIEIERRK